MRRARAPDSSGRPRGSAVCPKGETETSFSGRTKRHGYDPVDKRDRSDRSDLIAAPAVALHATRENTAEQCHYAGVERQQDTRLLRGLDGAEPGSPGGQVGTCRGLQASIDARREDAGRLGQG